MRGFLPSWRRLSFLVVVVSSWRFPHLLVVASASGLLEEVKLCEPAEEVASFYARMLDHEYTSKPVFNKNFFKDWRKTMTKEEREKIVDLNKCDFKAIQTHYLEQTEKRKAMSKEEKLKIKESKEKEAKEYGFAYIDGHKQKVGNFRIEPPGLFRGRGEHPKMGKLAFSGGGFLCRWLPPM